MVMRETTRMVTERVEQLIDEPCSMQACKKVNGQHAHALVIIITMAFDEYEGEFFNNEHPMCPGCADKVKRSFLGEKVVHREAYKETTTELSTHVVKFTETFDKRKGQDAEDLCNILYDTSPALRRAILDTPDNRNLLWWYADCTDAALRHFGMVISTKERNQLMHVENGNCGPNQYHPYIQQVAIQRTQ